MIAIRIALALVVAFAGFQIGAMFADRLRKRVQDLDEWQALLQLLQSDIAYGAIELPTALSSARSSLHGECARFAKRVAGRLEGHVRLADVWREELHRLAPDSPLLPEDRAPLLELGDALGRYGVQEHFRHIAHCQERLKLQRRRALEESERGQRLWRTLGGTAGAALALLLL